MKLGDFENRDFDRGRALFVEVLWIIIQAIFVSSWIPGSKHRVLLLKLFGAQIATGVVIKTGVCVKFPWRLKIGKNSWIGQNVWIDNLAMVSIANNCCVSQGAYLCTGNHDWSSSQFDLVTKPIDLGSGSWVAARAVVGPGVKVGEGAILTMGSAAASNLDSWSIYRGNPAKKFGLRRLRNRNGY